MKRKSFSILLIVIFSITCVGIYGIPQFVKATSQQKDFVFAKSLTELIDPMIGIDGEYVSGSLTNEPSFTVLDWDNVYPADQTKITKLAHSLGFFELINGTRHTHPIFAQISSSESQSVPANGAATNVTLNTNDEIEEITHDTSTNNHIIKIDTAGVYYFIVCGQVGQDTGGGGNHKLWMQKNGVNIANSATETYISNAPQDTSVVTLNWVGELEAGDEISFQQSGDDTALELKATGASSPVPETPSIIISIRGIAT